MKTREIKVGDTLNLFNTVNKKGWIGHVRVLKIDHEGAATYPRIIIQHSDGRGTSTTAAHLAPLTRHDREKLAKQEVARSGHG